MSGFDFPHGVNEEVSNRLQDALVVRDERDRWCDSAESSHQLEGDIQNLGVGMNSRYEVFGCSESCLLYIIVSGKQSPLSYSARPRGPGRSRQRIRSPS